MASISLKQVDDCRWLIPKTGAMRTEGLIYADEAMMKDIRKDASLEQVANVACLPGIVGRSMAMPDIHWGYGFPIGGVAAFDVKEGVISPGGVGYDINCGVRLLRTDLEAHQVRDKISDLVEALFGNVPCGIGSRRKDLRLSGGQMDAVLKDGARWAVSRGYGSENDLAHIEDGGCIAGADPAHVSEKAQKRGKSQLGTLGSGNHFVEIGVVDTVFDESMARAFSLFEGQLTIFIHTGSRGLGHQVCDDYIRVLLKASPKYGIALPDKQLCCAPVTSKEGQRYLAAMASAANFAFCNRQLIAHWVQETFLHVLGIGPSALGCGLVYDVCHNMAKIEEHRIDGQERRLCVHRKGATRAFPAKATILPKAYQHIGQPVLIPGDMGRYSYVLVGTEKGYQETFGSACHGAGRVMSRRQAKKAAKGRAIVRELADRGIVVRSAGRSTVAEEMPDAYKDVSDVVNVIDRAGLGKKVVRLRPLGVIKG